GGGPLRLGLPADRLGQQGDAGRRHDRPAAGGDGMSGNLCTLERARLNLPNALSTDERLIDALVGAASEAIRRWCRRRFTLGRYDEVLDGPGSARLMLGESPLQAVESVRYSPQSVLEVSNTATSANQQARVAVTSAGLELVRVASGTLSRDTSVTWAANPTL